MRPTPEEDSGPIRRVATRACLLEHTIEVIESAGEAAVRTREIVEHCGVTAPILYRAFGSKDGLVSAAHAERYRRALTPWREVLGKRAIETESADEFAEALSRALGDLLSPENARMRLIRCEVWGSAVARRELRSAIAETDRTYTDELVTALRFADTRGWLRPGVDSDVAAHWVLALVGMRAVVDLTSDDLESAKWDDMTLRSIVSALVEANP